MKKLTGIALLLMGLFSFVQAQESYHNWTEALIQAEQEQKDVLLVFSGSDWCKNCILLHRNILETTDFTDYERSNLVLYNADFPYQKKNKLSPTQTAQNEKLAEQFNTEGKFPKVILLDANGKIKGEIKTNRQQSTEQFLTQLSDLQLPQ